VNIKKIDGGVTMVRKQKGDIVEVLFIATVVLTLFAYLVFTYFPVKQVKIKIADIRITLNLKT